MAESQYQALVAAGGLAAVLREACPGSDIDLRDAPGAFGGRVATVSEGGRAVYVMPQGGQPRFSVRHVLNGTYLSHVATTELAEVTGCAAAWLGGATPRELAAAWPFADFVDVADAYESGDRIEFAWQLKRADRTHGLHEFVEAAMREPRLRRLHPFTSHWWMSFRVAPREHRLGGPWVRAVGGGRFSVTEARKPHHDGHDAAEAVRACVAELDRLGVR
ncbi:DUF6193 family natural product biosynthesis protein [Lentzea sp. NBRC 102530]|uniref:DUF6193 family natural product biosynthesis protein n=1 Tax=Lentzea sp. NBRC 102530 TaxID=3032201 RepID=UPI00249F9F76|nr:DUF6193 family natural product biosynthesis protein [Lentzea sp. NBRC 102530]GLY49648.1 hypothetical protein Lesp01_33040 [Lentzea sp. NBRC 102530]